MNQQQPSTLRLNPDDTVVVARVPVPAGVAIPEEGITTRTDISAGHKVATAAIEENQPVRKYGQIIGFATRPIRPGDHVHTHNLEVRAFARDYAFGVEAREHELFPEEERVTFEGFLRADGRVGTRNYIGVLTTVNCSATAARLIADHFRGEAAGQFPNLDGVIALTHGTGCGMSLGGDGYVNLRRVLAGYATHPNFAGVLIVGLGCETAQIDSLLSQSGLTQNAGLRTMNIQDRGGTAATVSEGIDQVRQMLAVANGSQRSPQPVGRLVLGLQCGGSDGYSGITANPALGAAVDLMVKHGGTAVLAETPEIYGAEHLLTRRAINREVGEKLIERVRWWEHYTAMNGGEMDNNPTPGNRKGGLTTILEKSLGASAKGGNTALMEVYRYAEPVTTHGFVFMDTPGYDPASVTGLVAGGANIACFTTGRGSVFGCKPSPCLKLATNTELYQRMSGDIDINCGLIADGECSVEEMGERIFREILATASGKPTSSELLGVGEHEFVPWQVGAVM